MMQSFIQNKKIVYAMLAVFAIAVMAFFLWNARWSIGVDYDSLFYLNSAQNLLAGNGLQWLGDGGSLKPLTHFPPLYPIFVALFSSFISDPLQAVTWLGAILFGVNITLVGLFVFTYTRNSLYALASMAVVFLSPDLIDVQLWAMSESLFFAWMLIGLILLLSYIKSGRTTDLLGVAVAAALACLTRYVGVTLVLTGLITILIYKRGIWSKIRSTTIYGLIALLPLGLWYLRNFLLTGSLANRNFAYHQITKVALGWGYKTILGWFFPFEWAFNWKILYLMAFGLALLVLYGLYGRKIFRTSPKDETSISSKRVLFVLSLFGMMYVVFLYLSMTYADASTRLNDRILSPLHIIFFLLVFVPAMVVSRRQGIIGATLILLMVVSFFPRARVVWSDFRDDGFGLSGESWQNSRAVSYARTLDANALIYSNEAVALQYLTGKPIYTIPQKFDKVKREDLADFESNLALMRENLKQDNAFLILFKARKGDEYPSVEILSEGLTLIKDMDDGLVYQYQP